MDFPSKQIIYVLVFIFVKLFHCIDMSDETAGITVNENGMSTSFAHESTNSTDQITKPDSQTVELLQNGDAMQVCNQTFRTPKGIV